MPDLSALIARVESGETGRYGRWTMIGEPVVKNRSRYVLCACSCGTTKLVSVPTLQSGESKSCGCLRTEMQTIHGKHRLPEHKAWRSALRRTQNTSDPEYPNYGGRGITMAPEFARDFEAFYKEVGPRPGANYSIDRIDNNKGYEPGNLRWATSTQQNRNTRATKLTEAVACEILSMKGTKKIVDMAKRYQVSRTTIWEIWSGRKWKDAAKLRAMEATP